MTDTQLLHQALLRPAVLHILRAAGFHSSKPSVVDTLTDLCSRQLLLLAQRTAHFTHDRTALSHIHPRTVAASSSDSPNPLVATDGAAPKDALQESSPHGLHIANTATATSTDMPQPTLSDVILALSSTYFFSASLTPSEEAWRETLRRPLSSYPEGATREKERSRRDAEDTRDAQEFVDWCTGDVAAEIRRIAGMGVKLVEPTGVLKDVRTGAATSAVGVTVAPTMGGVAEAGEPVLDKVYPDDYLALMKKKYSRTGDGARYAGTVLGAKHGRDGGDDRGTVRIEGGPESLRDWRDAQVKRRMTENAEHASRAQ